ncbi:hypothetical protein C4K25_5805 [Pseudomonas chlororaphis]|nr:hypothetical protein C4K25_5805 [Pseudomonas chlororaphis]
MSSTPSIKNPVDLRYTGFFLHERNVRTEDCQWHRAVL